MKKFIVLFIITFSFLIFNSCTVSVETDYQFHDGTYKDLSYMLKQCDSVAIIISKEYRPQNVKNHKHMFTVIDNKGDFYTYAGNNDNYEIGHTFYIKEPIKNKK